MLPVLISDPPLTNIHALVKFCIDLAEYETAVLIAGGVGDNVLLEIKSGISLFGAI